MIKSFYYDFGQSSSVDRLDINQVDFELPFLVVVRSKSLRQHIPGLCEGHLANGRVE